MKLSAHNILKGMVAKVTKNAVNGHKTIAIDGTVAQVKASIINEAIDNLDLKVGDKACAVI